ncbi:MAG: hypothetical protein UU85_C0004G0114 [Candidatus Wolfebacteria bacterium GW2011_GWA2_42_10]|uniref:Uncharacterized protein n=2 Tax=Candidatus Wolfeibacteriota TaxID=1752735 RepID=A0A0G0XKA4_9BACT|nr:MAG: hypothetical protein UU38_C0001G0175 [Candidatus Wolfebacteria bacterium GW2011_GWB1_41_12]KKS25355.1 MAG: hypothetical protein UU85_C0004G0114 [Candidatus Wolfebacteria bacterium GW2011_GWA2_42_10]KKT56794.1 MAG: hypothetical protein UW50_C0001G0363 [Candidatus Wolfebacteria bacterium GW2011_GWA1_44_24]
MIIFLYGPDSYRRRKKLNEMVSRYKTKHLSWENFDFGKSETEKEFSRCREFFASRSLFEKEKLGILEDIFAVPSEIFEGISGDLKNFLKSNLEDKNFILLISGGKTPPKSFSFLLEKPVLFQEFGNLEGDRLVFFIRKEARARGLELDSRAVNFLAEIFREDIWGLINELEKLSLLNSKKIDATRLNELIDYYRPLARPKFFNQLNGLFSHSLSRRLVDLEILFGHQEEPVKIFNILATSYLNTVFSLQKLADYDAAIKSGKLDYEEALVDLALEG